MGNRSRCNRCIQLIYGRDVLIRTEQDQTQEKVRGCELYTVGDRCATRAFAKRRMGHRQAPPDSGMGR
jgi:hypothetical protein